MDSIFKKLQFENQGRVLLLNSPEEFSAHVEAMAGLTEIHQQILAGNKYRFVLIFVKSSNDILEYFKFLNENLEEDPFLWFAYPKKSSKKYKSDISRDSGWQPLGSQALRVCGKLPLMMTGLLCVSERRIL